MAFTYYEKPVLLSACDPGDWRFQVLWGTGIVNPFGPTLELLAQETALIDLGDDAHPDTTRVLRMILSPFATECYILGEASFSYTWNPVKDLVPPDSGIGSSCPTLLLPNLSFTTELEVTFFAELLSRFPDGHNVLSRVKESPRDPWERTQADIRSAISDLTRLNSFRQSKSEPQRLTSSNATELAKLLLAPAYQIAEYMAFLSAWRDATELQKGFGGANVVLPLKQLATYIGQAALTCRVPSLPHHAAPSKPLRDESK